MTILRCYRSYIRAISRFDKRKAWFVNMKEITIPAKIEALDDVIAFVEEQLESVDCPMKIMMSLDVAVEEMYVNIAHYAYPDENANGEGMATIRFEHDAEQNAVTITLIDQGIQYNPLEKDDPDITLSAEERQIGGLGIFMVKKSMDEVAYKYENGSNIFSMKKSL